MIHFSVVLDFRVFELGIRNTKRIKHRACLILWEDKEMHKIGHIYPCIYLCTISITLTITFDYYQPRFIKVVTEVF